MATRYYLPSSSAAPPVSPAFGGPGLIWDDTTTASPDRVNAVTTKSSTALTDKAFTATGTNGFAFLMRQYVSAQIGVFNFNGTTVSAVIRSLVDATLNTTAKLEIYIYLYHANATTTDLLAGGDQDSAWGTTAATRIANAVALANVTSTYGDRIVIEIGMHNSGTSTASRTFTQRFGDNNASDFALTSGLTTDLNPWLEFSGNIPSVLPELTTEPMVPAR